MSVAVKRISKEPEPLVELAVPVSVATALADIAARLTTELGFVMTMEAAIGWLIKRVSLTDTQEALRKVADDLRREVIDEQCQMLMAKGEKINAIKLARAQFNIGLKEAKDYVESRWTPEYEAAVKAQRQ